jgi:hypothetical protein
MVELVGTMLILILLSKRILKKKAFKLYLQAFFYAINSLF